ncbi:hypothetical protein D3C73_998590 [compost metagenome]
MGQLMEMRRDKSFTGNRVMHIFYNRLGDSHTLAGRGSPSQLIDNNQTAGGCLLGHDLNVSHFHHEGALPTDEIVRRPDPGKDPVNQRHFRTGSRNETANLRQDADQSDLAHVGAFAGHIRSGDQQDIPVFLAQCAAVCYEC